MGDRVRAKVYNVKDNPWWYAGWEENMDIFELARHLGLPEQPPDWKGYVSIEQGNMVTQRLSIRGETSLDFALTHEDGCDYLHLRKLDDGRLLLEVDFCRDANPHDSLKAFTRDWPAEAAADVDTLLRKALAEPAPLEKAA